MRIDKTKATVNASEKMREGSYAFSVFSMLLTILPSEADDWTGEIRDALAILRVDGSRLAREYRVRSERMAADLLESDALEIIIKSKRR